MSCDGNLNFVTSIYVPTEIHKICFEQKKSMISLQNNSNIKEIIEPWMLTFLNICKVIKYYNDECLRMWIVKTTIDFQSFE